MSIITLIMHRKSIADSLMVRLRDKQDIKLIYQANYNNVNITINKYASKAVLIEVLEAGPYDIDYCLTLCEKLRKSTPECKLILMCSEHDQGSVDRIVNLKEKKQIDDFVFYDVTIDYLASKLISI